MRHCGLGKKWLVDFNAGKTQLISFDQCNDGSSKLHWCFYIISIAKTASKKIGALIHCMKFCHVQAGAPSCCLEQLGKLQMRICRTVGPSLAAFLEPLTHC